MFTIDRPIISTKAPSARTAPGGSGTKNTYLLKRQRSSGGVRLTEFNFCGEESIHDGLRVGRKN
jgi:hypothetical protein